MSMKRGVGFTWFTARYFSFVTFIYGNCLHVFAYLCLKFSYIVCSLFSSGLLVDLYLIPRYVSRKFLEYNWMFMLLLFVCVMKTVPEVSVIQLMMLLWLFISLILLKVITCYGIFHAHDFIHLFVSVILCVLHLIEYTCCIVLVVLQNCLH